LEEAKIYQQHRKISNCRNGEITAMKLSIIIVTYNASHVIETTLDSVYDSKVNFDYEVIIADNKSPDNSVEIIKNKYLSQPEIAAKTTLLELDDNYGFGIGNNRALEKAKGIIYYCSTAIQNSIRTICRSWLTLCSRAKMSAQRPVSWS
jgi:glycosyltransferase involved in cell wall biosynthesis